MYFLFFKNANLNYQVHPYFFLRRMLESKDEPFNLYKMVNKPNQKEGVVAFGFELQYQLELEFVNLTVNEILTSSGKNLMDKFSEMKEKKAYLTCIEYMFNDGRNSINITMDTKDYHRWHCTSDDRIIDNIHSDLIPEYNRFKLDWNDSRAQLIKVPESLLPLLHKPNRVLLLYNFGEALMLGDDGLTFGLP